MFGDDVCRGKGAVVLIPRVPSRGSARTLPKTASYIFLLSMTSRRGGSRTQTLAKGSARALLKPNVADDAQIFTGASALAQRLGTCCSGSCHITRARCCPETRLAPRSEPPSQSERFALELEFVMSLANPRYVHRASPTPRTSVHSFRI